MENPFKGGAPKITAPWWPEGEFREFCESVMEQVYRPRARWMRKPHLGEFFLVHRSFKRGHSES